MSPIYADYNATTPCSDAHIETVAKVLKSSQGNPSSVHGYGRAAKLVLEQSRSHVAALFGANRHQILFTSGATEANNLALHAAAMRCRGRPLRGVATVGEHPSLIAPLRALEAAGAAELTWVGLDPSGQVDLEQWLAALNERTDFATLFWVHPETGAVNPLAQWIEATRQAAPRAHVHVDAVQAWGKLPSTWFAASSFDSAAISGHKVGALKGIGCLYSRQPELLAPLIHGGGQERSYRSGTENMPGIISIGLRAREIASDPNSFVPAQEAGRHLWKACLAIPEVEIYGDFAKSLQTTLCLSLRGIDVETISWELDSQGIAVSRGSACASGLGKTSESLLSMGCRPWQARNAIRISFGAASRLEDAAAIANTLAELCTQKTAYAPSSATDSET